MPSHRSATRLFTLGYQLCSPETYVAALIEAGVGVVFDVRLTPWSRKPGFSKSALSAHLSQSGIEYAHLGFLGNPSENRRDATPEESLAGFRRRLEENAELVEKALVCVRDAHRAGLAPCLTCYERIPQECHRSVIAEFLAAADARISVVHLTAASPEQRRRDALGVPQPDNHERRRVKAQIA
jgi:uncharacterized protein (DUF488 family)